MVEVVEISRGVQRPGVILIDLLRRGKGSACMGLVRTSLKNWGFLVGWENGAVVCVCVGWSLVGLGVSSCCEEGGGGFPHLSLLMTMMMMRNFSHLNESTLLLDCIDTSLPLPLT